MMRKGWKRAIKPYRKWVLSRIAAAPVVATGLGHQVASLLIIKCEVASHGRRTPCEGGGSGDRLTLAPATPPGPGTSPPARFTPLNV